MKKTLLVLLSIILSVNMFGQFDTNLTPEQNYRNMKREIVVIERECIARDNNLQHQIWDYAKLEHKSNVLTILGVGAGILSGIVSLNGDEDVGIFFGVTSVGLGISSFVVHYIAVDRLRNPVDKSKRNTVDKSKRKRLLSDENRFHWGLTK